MTTKPPRCRLCGHEHWIREPCVFSGKIAAPDLTPLSKRRADLAERRTAPMKDITPLKHNTVKASEHNAVMLTRPNAVMSAKASKSIATLEAEIIMLQAEVKSLKQELARHNKPISSAAMAMRRWRSKRKQQRESET